ncbi:hypothetical protein ACP0HM_10760 [Escherichia coli]
MMAYSDAGSAFIFGSLVGPKMDTLFDGAGFYLWFQGITGNYLRHRTGEYSLLHRCDGDF